MERYSSRLPNKNEEIYLKEPASKNRKIIGKCQWKERRGNTKYWVYHINQKERKQICSHFKNERCIIRRVAFLGVGIVRAGEDDAVNHLSLQRKSKQP